ncbi:MAG: NUDIX domain-containing protein [Candidatus Saccharibacteria bacterium]|nr:NUDIX domain-containing protein [Candidatus Saccharibacteria bacterium]
MIGRLVERTEGLTKHFVATGFVVNQNYTKMLLIYHKKLKKWAAPGGHIEPTETPEEAAIREIIEETHITPKLISEPQHDLKSKGEVDAQIETPYAILYELIPETQKEGPEHIHVDFLYVFEADDNEPIEAQLTEAEVVKWCTRAEVLELDAFDVVKNFAEKYLLQ